jgi:transcriptional regulator with XRE-family HTH domain
MPDWVLPRRREIGLRIATRRRALGLVVDDVAEATGLNRKTIMAVEGALNAPGLDVLLLIAHALDVPLAYLVAGAGEQSAAE